MKKSIKILIAMVLLNLFLGGMLLSRSFNSPINTLINPKTRLETYMELRQSEMPLTDDIYSVIIRKIPAENDSQHPFYLILWEYRRLRPARGISFPGEKFRKPGHIVITPPLEYPTAIPAPAEYFMSLISHDGRLLDQERPRPFGGYNLVREGDIIFDINQDGQVDWVSTRHYSQSGSAPSVKVIQIARMSYHAEVLFQVAVFPPSNLITTRPKGDLANEVDWSFQCVDEDGDGMLDLQIGPEKENSITPKVTFYWNPDTETFESPAGKMGPYFRVLSTSRSWRLRREDKLIFPFDKMR